MRYPPVLRNQSTVDPRRLRRFIWHFRYNSPTHRPIPGQIMPAIKMDPAPILPIVRPNCPHSCGSKSGVEPRPNTISSCPLLYFRCSTNGTRCGMSNLCETNRDHRDRLACVAKVLARLGRGTRARYLRRDVAATWRPSRERHFPGRHTRMSVWVCAFLFRHSPRVRPAETAADAGTPLQLVLAKYAPAFSMALFIVNIPRLMLRDLDFLVGHPTLSTTFKICQSASR